MPMNSCENAEPKWIYKLVFLRYFIIPAYSGCLAIPIKRWHDRTIGWWI